jgi:tetratricopeptide (TPR) repeat protein
MARFPDLLDDALASALSELYIETISGNPTRAAAAAQALSLLAERHPGPLIQAYADWTVGMATLQIEGRPEAAITLIDAAAAGFTAQGDPHSAATTQISKLFALALLGRYDEAITCGEQARDHLRELGDQLGASKVAQNLGNLHHRRGQYHYAESHYREARELAMAAADPRMIAFAENGLANILALQHRPREAGQLYEHAMEQAAAVGATVTQAEIECNLGCLALYTGRYDEALCYLERSRDHYNALKMPHESLLSELELADAYLELNMAAEAAASYSRLHPALARLAMQAEQARAYLGHGRACLLSGQIAEARTLSELARDLYSAEGNRVGAAMAVLSMAQIAYAAQDFAAAAALAAAVEADLERLGAWGHLLLSRWLHGESRRMLGEEQPAAALLTTTLETATPDAPQIAHRCLTSLGLLALRQGSRATAETYLIRACDLIEQLRAPLPAEELRAAFIADKLTPFFELARICLSDPRADRRAEALVHVERARARALLDLLRREPVALGPPAPGVADLVEQFEVARTELSWFDSQLSRLGHHEQPVDSAQIAVLQQGARSREQLIVELGRRIARQRGPSRDDLALDLPRLTAQLGAQTVLVEYVYLDSELLAFVVGAEGVQVVRGLANVSQVSAALNQFRFQLGTLRHGARLSPAALAQLVERTQHHLRALYRLLLAPIEPLIGDRQLIVVPHRELYYIPFHALHDGDGYLIERREVSYAPSARVYQSVAARAQRPLDHALLIGVPDERTPRLQEEIDALGRVFPSATTLLGSQASREALRQHGASADVLHLACHGEFRPDSPLLSALYLADGRLTVHDIYQLQLGGELAVLSACESGVSTVAPGDEIFGLIRGFFAAGIPALVVSLWAVDDSSTTRLMQHFYATLLAGASPATALRSAQLTTLHEQPHPFFWAPFILVGRR